MKNYLILVAAPVILLAANQPRSNDPFAAMTKMQREMDAEMARFQQQMIKEMNSGNVISLNANMSNPGFKTEGDHYDLSVPIPDASAKSIHIRTEKRIMTVTAGRQEVRDENTTDHYYRERSMSSYAYSFSVPKDAEMDHMKTKYEKGILTITMPKKKSISLK
jgi:HSP20 family molecular chaperone IbpA